MKRRTTSDLLHEAATVIEAATPHVARPDLVKACRERAEERTRTDGLEREYLLFWTYSANYANEVFRVRAAGPVQAMKLHLYSGNADVRFLVMEVGGDLVWDGKCPQVSDDEAKELDETTAANREAREHCHAG